MAIKIRRGSIVDFDQSKMLFGELAMTSEGEMYFCYEDGKCSQVQTKEEFERILRDYATLTDLQDLSDEIDEKITTLGTTVTGEINTLAETVEENRSTLSGNIETLAETVASNYETLSTTINGIISDYATKDDLQNAIGTAIEGSY